MSNQVNLNVNLDLYKSLSVTQNQKTKENKTTTQTQTANNSGVILELGASPEKGATYSKPASKALSSEEIQKLQDEVENRTETLRNLVEKLILGQANAAGGFDMSSIFSSEDSSDTNTKIKINGGVNLTEEEAALIAGAEDSLSEDGENGIEAVSNRIVDFAKALSGGDKSKYEILKAGIEEGFKQAGDVFGGELPEISVKTYDAVMEKLDKWYNEE